MYTYAQLLCLSLLFLGACSKQISTQTENPENEGNEMIFDSTKALIRLVSADLPLINSLTLLGESVDIEGTKPLEGNLTIELVDKAVFEAKKSTAITFLQADTNTVKKKNGVIELICAQKTKIYIDKPDVKDEVQVYEYVGTIDFLNQYLIKGAYYEGTRYHVIDKTNGEETAIFIGYPHISADKKHLICVYTNPYERTCEMSVFSIVGKQITSKLSTSFSQWMPLYEKEDAFWGADGFFYLTAMHSKAFWKEDGSLNENRQYLRIKVLK